MKIASIFAISIKFGVINASPNQAADKLPKTAESALRNGKYLFTMDHTLTKKGLSRQEGQNPVIWMESRVLTIY